MSTAGPTHGHCDSQGLTHASLRRQPPSPDFNTTPGLTSSGAAPSPASLNPTIKKQLHGFNTSRE